MKPSWNAVSAEGMKICAPSIDTLGWYGRSAADIAILCNVFQIADDNPATIPSLDKARIAVCRSPVWEQA